MEVLKKVEPTAVELTKDEYERRMGIVPNGGKGKKSKDVGQPVGKGAKKQAETPLLGRQAAIKVLREKGHEYKDLKSKTREQLNDML